MSSSVRLPGVSGPEPDMEPQVSGGRRGDDSRLAAPLSADRPEASVRPAGPRSACPAPWDGSGVESGEGRERPRRAGARRPAFSQLQGATAPFLTFVYPGFPVSNLQACLNTFPPVHSV